MAALHVYSLQRTWGAGDQVKLYARRVTFGVKRSGQRFVIEDNWTDKSCDHRMLPFEWRGGTRFFSKLDGVPKELEGVDGIRLVGDVDATSTLHTNTNQQDNLHSKQTHIDSRGCRVEGTLDVNGRGRSVGGAKGNGSFKDPDEVKLPRDDDRCLEKKTCGEDGVR